MGLKSLHLRRWFSDNYIDFFESKPFEFRRAFRLTADFMVSLSLSRHKADCVFTPQQSPSNSIAYLAAIRDHFHVLFDAVET
jgi:hypothetical protein